MQHWYVHIQGDTIGPLPTDAVAAMLKQNRLQFVDFIWANHLTKWQRIGDLDDFAALMPSYPKAPIPSRQTDAPAAPVAEAKPALAPAPAPAPKAKVEFEEPVAPAAQASAPTKKNSAPPKVWPKSRKSIRVPAGQDVAVLNDHGTFEVLNVSEGGVFLKSDRPLEVGLEVKLKLELVSMKKSLEMTAIVIRHGNTVDNVAGFALQFTRLNPAHKRLLQDYVNERAPVE